MKKVNNVLIAIMFVKPLTRKFSFFDLTARFKDKFRDIFGDIEPISPIPPKQSAPPEIPRYILETNDLDYQFSFSEVRFEFNFNNVTDFNIELLGNYVNSIQDVLQIFSLNTFRVGIVLTGIIDSEYKAEKYLKQYIQIDELDSAVEFEISFRELVVDKSFTLNKWIRHSALKGDNKVNFHIDVNSADLLSTNQLLTVFTEIMAKELGDFIGS